MPEKTVYDVAIVGGGIAGFEAALALRNFKRSFIWLGNAPFGALPLAEKVQNFPSYMGSGRELCALLELQAKEKDIALTPAHIDKIYKMGQGFLLTQGEKEYFSRSVIFAPGVCRKPALKGEREFLGRGLSYCAVCDGALYRGKKILAIVKDREYLGEVEYLAGFAEKVYAYCPFATNFQANNIEKISARPLEIAGEGRVQRVIFEGNITLELSGVFLLTSAVPPSAVVGGLKEEGGHVRVERDMSTNLPGFFAAGDVTGRPYQYAKAAGEGLVAAFSANDFVSANFPPYFKQ